MRFWCVQMERGIEALLKRVCVCEFDREKFRNHAQMVRYCIRILKRKMIEGQKML